MEEEDMKKMVRLKNRKKMLTLKSDIDAPYM
jgi:hypothetical protein